MLSAYDVEDPADEHDGEIGIAHHEEGHGVPACCGVELRGVRRIVGGCRRWADRVPFCMAPVSFLQDGVRGRPASSVLVAPSGPSYLGGPACPACSLLLLANIWSHLKKARPF